MAYETLSLDREGPLATLTMRRAEKLNALNPQVMEELGRALDSLRADRSVRGLVVTGEGRAFVAGADIAWMAELGPAEARRFAAAGQRVLFRLEEAPWPVVAAVNGFCLGGGLELAMACDLIVASEKARFGQPEVTLGVVPGFMGSQRLPRLVGPAKAKELLMTGEVIDAAEALRIGLATRVVPGDALLPECRKLLARIAANGPLAVAQAKRLANLSMGTDLATGGSMEAEAFGVLFSTGDQREGMKAFLAKRKPEFTGE